MDNLHKKKSIVPKKDGNVKVLIYSSKELYDNSSYAGRAEAHLIAYAFPGLTRNMYMVVKDRYEILYSFERDRPVLGWKLRNLIEKYEREHNDTPLIPELVH